MTSFKCLLILFFLGTTFMCVAQQQLERSAYDSNAFIWNPAMTSINDYWEVGANYRQQWAGFDDAPRAITASIQYPFQEKNMSLGMYLLNDQTHPLIFNAIGFTYNYQLKLNLAKEDYLSIGILGSYGEYRVDMKNIVTSDGADPLTPTSGGSMIIPNLGAGLFYTTNKDKFDNSTLYVGVSASQLLSSDLILEGADQDINLERVPHANVILGATILIERDLYFEPSVWANYASPNIFDVNLGARIEQENIFWAGANFTTSQTLSAQGGIILTDGLFEDGQLRIGGLATYNVGKLGSALGVGYEFYLAYRFYK